MSTYIVGYGKIGKAIHKYMYFNSPLIEIIDIKNSERMKEIRSDDTVNLCVPSYALEDVRKKIKTEPIIYTPIKGIYKNKLVNEWFKRVELVYCGYFTPDLFNPHKEKREIRSFLLAGVYKNLYLVLGDLISFNEILEDIKGLNIYKRAKEVLLEDYLLSKKYNSRNYKYGAIRWNERSNSEDIIRILGLVEGVEIIKNNTLSFSPLIDRTIDKYWR